MRRFQSVLEGFDIKPVLVVRRQDDFVRSLYQEHVTQGRGVTARMKFGDYLEKAAIDKSRFLERLRLFRSVFGSVHLMIYERLRQAGLPSAFFSELGLDVAGGQHSLGETRKSPSPGETILKQKLNPWVRNDRQNVRLIKWLRSRRMRELLERQYPADLSLWSSEKERSNFMRRFQSENEHILAEFGDSQWRTLFPQNAPESVKSSSSAAGEVEEATARILNQKKAKLASILGRDALEQLING